MGNAKPTTNKDVVLTDLQLISSKRQDKTKNAYVFCAFCVKFQYLGHLSNIDVDRNTISIWFDYFIPPLFA